MKLDDHPTVRRFRLQTVPPAAPKSDRLDPAWLKQLVLDAGADDAGFVEIGRPDLDDQRDDILAAVNDVARLSSRFAGQRTVITKALDEIGPALETLSTERPDITGALGALTDLADVVVPLVRNVRDGLVSDLENLDPVVRGILDAGKATVTALGFALTFPFAPETVTNACRGDYCNLTMMLDLTNSALTNGFIKPDGSLGIPGFPGLDVSGLLGLLGLGGTVDGVPGLVSGLTGNQHGDAAPPNLSLEGLLGGLAGGSS